MNRTTSMFKRADDFFTEMLGRSEPMLCELDIAMHDTNGRGLIHYPESFNRVIETKAVKRMARIFQLGTKIYTRDNVIHTRLEHSKGTYYRTLELLMNLCEDQKVKDLIINNNYQKYILAMLARALLHDVGHGPFSHTMETVCNLPKGFHEDIGRRLINEDPELRAALEGICPHMPELLNEVVERDFLGLNRLFEGQSDVDRGDFLPRDSFFADANFSENSRAVAELFSHVSIEKVCMDGKKSMIAPVFSEDQIGNLDTFFMNRFENYKNIYYAHEAISYDYVFKTFAEKLTQSSEDYRLKTFLLHNMNKKPEEIDLQEYISFNDVEYLKGIVEVLDKTQDPCLRKFAIMSLPPKEKILDFYYGLMISPEQVRDYKDNDFFMRLEYLPDSESEYRQNCLVLHDCSRKNIQSVTEKIKSALGVSDENLEDLGIFTWKNTVSTYKKKRGEETFVKGADGKVYEYSVHPERRAPLISEDVNGFCVLVPILESKGFSKKSIDDVRSIMTDYKDINSDERREKM